MAQNNHRISASELDFDAIKTSLKTYLSGQSTFSGYDFEGPNMSMLLDVLAYNTHYRALYDNFMLNESFLDSASKRANVVSRAAEIGYMPVSAKAATATINLSFNGVVNGAAMLTLPKQTPFSASINGISYTFITTETYSAPLVNNSYAFGNIKISQGAMITTRMNIATGARYIIPNTNVDTSTFLLKIQENAQSSVYTPFYQASTFIGISGAGTIYWVKEIDGGLYELQFGNGVFGKALVPGNVIHLEYLVTDGPAANSAKLFRYMGSDIYQSVAAITVVSQSTGGTSIESIDSIKFNAPRLYSAQNRAVTVEDYQNLVYDLVPEAASVNVWSGADNVPPSYGKVYICIKPKTVTKFTNVEKVAIKSDIIKYRNVVTVIPEIVDPQYIKVALSTTIYFNKDGTTKSANDIAMAVKNAILQFDQENLQKFGGILRFSKLMRVIDDSDASIVSNVTNVTLHKPIEPQYNVNATYSINLINPIYVESDAATIRSSGFYIFGSELIHYLRDDGLGNINVYVLDNGVEQITAAKSGSVIYSKGLIEINNLHITTIIGTELILTIKPSSNDIVSVLDQLVIIPTELISVNVIADKSISASGGGANYEFTSSHT